MALGMKAVIFDLDETLLDRTGSLIDFVNWQATGMLKNSISEPSKFCRRFINLDANGSVWKDEVYKHLIGEYEITDWTVEELLTSYEFCFSGFCKSKKGSVDAIKELKSLGIKIGLVSNGNSPFQERNFNALGISEMFDSIIVSGAVGYRKPQKEIFELACSQIAVSSSDTVFVGDNPTADIDGANACGMYTIYIPGIHGSQCESANVVCENFSQLVGLVKNAI
jgi:putative hydrolase of the HAD superfamily